jgi:hypothetical protein
MSEPEYKPQEYIESISEMFDEAKPLMEVFQSMFDDNPVGQLKYLFALHCMLEQACHAHGVPVEAFAAFVTHVTAIWHVSEKPENFEFKVLAMRRLHEEGGVTD